MLRSKMEKMKTEKEAMAHHIRDNPPTGVLAIISQWFFISTQSQDPFNASTVSGGKLLIYASS